MYCKYCGTENGDNASFCRGCGKQISSTRHTVGKNERASVNTSGGGGKRRPSRRKPIIIAIVVVVVLVLGGAIFFWRNTSMPVDAIATEDALETLAKANGGNLPEMYFDEDTGKLCFIDGAYTDRSIRNADDAIESLIDIAPLYGINDPQKEFRLIRQDEHEGTTFYRLQQYYQDIEVCGSQLVLSVDGKGNPISVGGEYESGIDIETSHSINEQDAYSALTGQIPNSATMLSPDMVIYCGEKGPTLAYRISVFGGNSHALYYISADSPQIIGKEDLTFTENVGTLYSGSYGITAYDAQKGDLELENERGKDEHGNGYTFTTPDSNGSFWFIDRDGEVLDDDNGSYYIRLYKNGKQVAEKAAISNVTVMADGRSLDPADINLQRMTNLEDNTLQMINNTVKVCDFYKEIFGRDSYNGEGGAISLVANEKFDDTDNAHSILTTPYLTVLGFSYLNNAPIDTVAHEYTHSVERTISAMNYSGESGALMEAYSDIFGEIVEDYCDDNALNGSCNWAQYKWRDIANPEKTSDLARDNGPCPTYYKGKYWGDASDKSKDNGYVHNNSTVISHVAYLSNQNGIDMEDLARIWFGSLHYLSQNASFTTCRAAVIASAKALGYSDAVVDVIKNAFDDAGIAGGATALTPEADIHVFNSDGSPHDGFDIKLTTKLAYHSNGDERWAHVDGSTKKLNEIMADPLLGNDSIATGAYLLTITDSEGSGASKAQYVAIHNQGLIQFDVNLGTEGSRSNESNKTNGESQGFQGIAEEFVKAWYNDWTFEDGEMKINQTPHSERCLPYIAKGTALYSEFSDETNFYAGSGSRLSRGAALSVATIGTALGDNNTVTVDVAFYGAQNTITQEMFDQIKDRPANRNTWTLTFDDNGKIIGLENGVTAEGGAEDNASQYESTLSAYRSGLNSDTQPPYDAVNPEAWIAREYNKGRYAYALYDINGDGSDELLIGLEESAPVSEEGLEVYYRLYDLFTLDNGKPVRVLGDDGMTSLGYRAFCIPCENNIIATGGSGGATYHIREYWRLGEKANDMSLMDRVTMDADEFTFEDNDGKSEVLSGEQARSRYEKGVIARYTPITKFVWHSL